MGENGQTYFEDLDEGMELPPVARQGSTTQLFLFSAITRNAHRIHYDKDYAESEEHPGVLVHGPLHGAMLSSYVTNWAGDEGWLRKLSYQNRGPATPEDVLTFKGRVTRKYQEGENNIVEIDVWEENQRGEVTVPGSAVVYLPSRDA
jgi:hydroxyacyl-ACP dehydratase HTD2-like protein with hotdog domain